MYFLCNFFNNRIIHSDTTLRNIFTKAVRIIISMDKFSGLSFNTCIRIDGFKAYNSRTVIIGVFPSFAGFRSCFVRIFFNMSYNSNTFICRAAFFAACDSICTKRLTFFVEISILRFFKISYLLYIFPNNFQKERLHSTLFQLYC